MVTILQICIFLRLRDVRQLKVTGPKCDSLPMMLPGDPFLQGCLPPRYSLNIFSKIQFRSQWLNKTLL